MDLTRIEIDLPIEDPTPERIERYRRIFYALVKTGSLDGIKSGCVRIHFNAECGFEGIQFDYWPWRERHLTKK